MKWFHNIRMRFKLLVAFGVVLLFSLIVAVFSMLALNSIKSHYDYTLSVPVQRHEILLKLQSEFITMRMRAITFITNTRDYDTLINVVIPQYTTACANTQELIDDYIKINSEDTNASAQEIAKQNIENMQTFSELLVQYQDVANNVLEVSKTGDFDNADIALKATMPHSAVMIKLLDDMITTDSAYIDSLIEQAQASAQRTFIVISALSIVILLLSVIMALVISGVISKAINSLLKVTESVVNGNLNVNKIHVTKDEIGMLVQNFFTVTNVIKMLVDDINFMATQHHLGDIDVFIDESKYKGSYNDVVVLANQMVSEHINAQKQTIVCMTEMVDGDFSAPMLQLPGKKAFINEAVENLRNSLRNISGEVDTMIKNTLDGKLSERIGVNKYKGDWGRLMTGLNEVLNAVSVPINEATEVMHNVAEGNFDKKVKGDYKGDFLLIKNAINDTVTNVASYIDEISLTLETMVRHDFNVSITREYVGKFSNIKNALNDIIKTLNGVLSEISAAANQVSVGSKQISNSSMDLASGSIQQTSSISDLNDAFAIINENTSKNVQSAHEAKKLSDTSRNNAAKGEQDMNNMLSSMDSIKESSNSISKIIKVIDDIAFQTNLLALNAAVEAARAGEHGKGFAVVAEEVRNLAGRSQEAARETSQLIEESINRVNAGKQLADTTASALLTIVNDVAKVADIISDISDVSNQQESIINTATGNILNITDVVKANSAISESSASAAQQLSSQAETLLNKVSVFKLTK